MTIPLVKNVLTGVTFIPCFFRAIDSFSLSDFFLGTFFLCLFVSNLVFHSVFFAEEHKEILFKGQ